jgi:hypothetical protein
MFVPMGHTAAGMTPTTYYLKVLDRLGSANIANWWRERCGVGRCLPKEETDVG